MLAVLKDWWLGEEVAAVVRVVASAVVVYMLALWIVRTGKKRFLGRNTVFDFLLAFILGSVLARGINGGAPLLSTALAGFALVIIHWLFGILAMRSHRFGLAVKGGSDQLVDHGKLNEETLRDHHLTEQDLLEAARAHGVHEVEGIQEAYFERSGSISIVPKFRTRVVSVDVKEGVQKVELSIRV